MLFVVVYEISICSFSTPPVATWKKFNTTCRLGISIPGTLNFFT